MIDEKDMNPRYVAYAKLNGKTPAEMLESDRETWPGGCMCGFILWISENERSFFRMHPEAYVGRSIRDQKKFDEFLGPQS